MNKTKILLVDDERNILTGYKRNLRNHFDITVSDNARDALKIIDQGGRFPVIVSDMRMPVMDGAEFLSKVRQTSPQSVRLLLTGHSDMDQTIRAINEGQIFRFLAKPLSPVNLKRAIDDAKKQFFLEQSEKILLDKTLRNSVNLMVDLLSNSFPEAFDKSNRIKEKIEGFYKEAKMNFTWETEISILLSQIGTVTLPKEIVDKKFNGILLIDEEKQIFFRHPLQAYEMLKNIPRLEKVAGIIKYTEKKYNGNGYPDDDIKGPGIPFLSRFIKIVSDFDSFMVAGFNELQSLKQMKSNPSSYDPKIFNTFGKYILPKVKVIQHQNIPTETVESDMVIFDDILDQNTGLLLIPKMHKVTAVSKARIYNYWKNGNIADTLKVVKN